jgi:hypothetical protein
MDEKVSSTTIVTANKTVQGLHLKDKVIHRISGPVGMYYLRPKSDLFLMDKRQNLPLILLFGDIHRDDTGMCDDCSCTADGSNSCCHRIYDKEFLQELDKLADKYPVDFYTEYSKSFPVSQDPKNILFKRFLEDTTKACHKKELRLKRNYESQCPTKNIRWHYADPRFMDHTLERYAFEMPHLLTMVVFIQHPETGATNRVDKLTRLVNIINGIQFMRMMYKEKMIMDASPSLQSMVENGFQLFQKIMEIIILKPMSAQEISGDLRFKLLHDKYKLVFTEYLKQAKIPKQSVIYKQLTRFSSKFDSDDVVIQFLNRLWIRNHSAMLLQLENVLAVIPPVFRMILTHAFISQAMGHPLPVSFPLFSQLHEVDIKSCISTIQLIKNVIFEMNSMFVEVFTLFRMMKPPKESSSPYLVMGYFGQAHIDRLIWILQSKPYFDYELVYGTYTGYDAVGRNSLRQLINQPGFHKPPMNHRNHGKAFPDMRCITIQKPVLLADDLEEHAQRILAIPEYRMTHEKYRKVMEKEEEERNINRLMGIENPFNGGKRSGKTRTRRRRALKKTKKLCRR